jgi:hypothetical protein
MGTVKLVEQRLAVWCKYRKLKVGHKRWVFSAVKPIIGQAAHHTVA